MTPPDENERVARAAMAGARFADVRWVASTGSTNADLIAELKDPSVNVFDGSRRREGGSPHRGDRVLVTDFQAAGKGRRGRQWEAPPGAGLLVSVLVSNIDVAEAHLVTSAMGLAASDACADVAAIEPQLKWPNDLLVDGRKLAGILAEAAFGVDGQAAVVVGMGMNVNWATAMPADLATTAVALDHLSGRTIDRRELLTSLLSHLERWLAVSPAALRDAHRDRSATIGRTVRVEQLAGELRGEAIDIADDGQLIIENAAGRHTVSVGDVVHLRATEDPQG